jgi:glycine hydroxymethyltransferase
MTPAVASAAAGTAAGIDAELAAALDGERLRQESFLELIASENYVSRAVLEAQGSSLTNKYADGYPGRRTYSGCEFADVVERLAIARAKRLFDAGYANVQPYSGSSANAAVYAALMAPGETLLGMSAQAGGHITHGDPSSFSGQLFTAVRYGVVDGSGWIDYDRAAELARAHRPKVVVAGFSAYSRVVDWARFREIADSVGAYLLVDMAHVAGLVAAGLYPNPVPIADVVTTTTHKTLRGPRGGMILARDEALAAPLDAAVYPGQQGGPLMHVIAAKAAALHEALEPPFADYQRRTIANARRLAETLIARGFHVVTGGTDNHMMLVELGGRPYPADAAEAALERARIAVNGMAIPRAGGTSIPGLRLGTPAITTRGIGPETAVELGGWIADVLDDPASPTVIARVCEQVLALCRDYPVYARA